MSKVKVANLESIAPLIDDIRCTYVDKGLSFGWKSNSALPYDHGHWNNNILNHHSLLTFDHQKLPYIDEHPSIKKVFQHLTKSLGPRVLTRAYVNGYTYGTDAYFHQDDTWVMKNYGNGAVSETILVYLNWQEWDPNWGGETSFIDNTGPSPNFITSVFPKPYRAVIFSSDIWHSARSLTRACPHLRSILAFKTTSPLVQVPYVHWLYDNTRGIPHSGSDFFFHLYETAMILAREKEPGQMIKAALFHSIYDTEYFKANLNVTRDEVKKMIGDQAEELAYIFCTTKDRLNSFIENRGNWDSFTRYALLTIEKANLIEQLPRFKDIRQVNTEKRVNMLREELTKFKVKRNNKQTTVEENTPNGRIVMTVEEKRS